MSTELPGALQVDVVPPSSVGRRAPSCGAQRLASAGIGHLVGRCEPMGKGSEPFQGTTGLRKRRGGIGQAGKGGKTPELRATSSNQSGVLSFLKKTSVPQTVVKIA